LTQQSRQPLYGCIASSQHDVIEELDAPTIEEFEHGFQ
jgi:hypothetical protein